MIYSGVQFKIQIFNGQVKFKSYSAKDCKKYTIYVAELKRQYKNLNEILKDAEVLINNSKITEVSHSQIVNFFVFF